MIRAARQTLRIPNSRQPDRDLFREAPLSLYATRGGRSGAGQNNEPNTLIAAVGLRRLTRGWMLVSSETQSSRDGLPPSRGRRSG
jgi:hypothetical protein